MLGDKVAEFPNEEEAEKTLNIQETPKSDESGESPEEEAQEYRP